MVHFASSKYVGENEAGLDAANNSKHKPSQAVVLYEVSENVKDVQAEIKKIHQLSSKKRDYSKLELLVDGGVFAKMLQAKPEDLVKLNEALNMATAVIIYRASPK